MAGLSLGTRQVGHWSALPSESWIHIRAGTRLDHGAPQHPGVRGFLQNGLMPLPLDCMNPLLLEVISPLLRSCMFSVLVILVFFCGFCIRLLSFACSSHMALSLFNSCLLSGTVPAHCLCGLVCLTCALHWALPCVGS